MQLKLLEEMDFPEKEAFRLVKWKKGPWGKFKGVRNLRLFVVNNSTEQMDIWNQKWDFQLIKEFMRFLKRGKGGELLNAKVGAGKGFRKFAARR